MTPAPSAANTGRAVPAVICAGVCIGRATRAACGARGAPHVLAEDCFGPATPAAFGARGALHVVAGDGIGRAAPAVFCGAKGAP